MRIANESITLSSTDLSANRESDPIYIGHLINFSLQFVVSGTPNGTFKVQFSNDVGNSSAIAKSNEDFNVSNFSDIPNASVSAAAAGVFGINVADAGYRWIKVVWTAAGAGTTPVLTSARFNGKGV